MIEEGWGWIGRMKGMTWRFVWERREKCACRESYEAVRQLQRGDRRAKTKREISDWNSLRRSDWSRKKWHRHKISTPLSVIFSHQMPEVWDASRNESNWSMHSEWSGIWICWRLQFALRLPTILERSFISTSKTWSGILSDPRAILSPSHHLFVPLSPFLYSLTSLGNFFHLQFFISRLFKFFFALFLVHFSCSKT